MEKFILSNMKQKNFSKAVNEIYLTTDYNHKQYQKYCQWFYQKSIPRIFTGTGEVFFYLDGLTIVALSILKRDVDEKKICTLLVSEEFRKKGLSHLLLEDSFKFLGTDKPLITISSNIVEQFYPIIAAYDWKESSRTNQYLSEEIIFNQ